jgi:hypothetical protein
MFVIAQARARLSPDSEVVCRTPQRENKSVRQPVSSLSGATAAFWFEK